MSSYRSTIIPNDNLQLEEIPNAHKDFTTGSLVNTDRDIFNPPNALGHLDGNDAKYSRPEHLYLSNDSEGIQVEETNLLNKPGQLEIDQQHDLVPTPDSTKRLISRGNDRAITIDCVGRRRQRIGERCLAVMVLFLVTGTLVTSFGVVCIVPMGDSIKSYYCKTIGGLLTALLLLALGTILMIIGIISCVLIHECSGKELHGGKCHINCHVFDDLVE